MESRETFQKEAVSSSADTTLEALREKEKHFRSRLQEKLPGDERFSELARRAAEYLIEAASSHTVGFERVRLLAAAEALMKEIAQTERGKVGGAFMETSSRREAAEEEVKELRQR